jgi:hypothetical protein
VATCLYCANLADSQEHLFPHWINEVLGYDEPTYLFLGDYGWKRDRPATYKLRVVCETCNNGWMSKIEKEARPILTPMILGQSSHLDVAQQRTIAAWALSRAVIGEHLPQPHVWIPDAHRYWLRDHLEPPPQVNVVAATTDGLWWQPGPDRVGNVHFSHGAMAPNVDQTHLSPILVKGAVIGYNATIIIRHLALQVSCNIIEGGRLSYSTELSRFLTEVWSDPMSVDWPARPAMARPQVEHLITAWRGVAPFKTPWTPTEAVDELANRPNRKARRAAERAKKRRQGI